MAPLYHVFTVAIIVIYIHTHTHTHIYIYIYRIMHPNFEFVHHDVIEPFMMEVDEVVTTL